MQDKDIKEKIKKIISIIINSDEFPINNPNNKIIGGNNYREICQLLGIDSTTHILRQYKALSTLISDYSGIFGVYGITTETSPDYLSFYNGMAIVFSP
jgi:hypothetical protein